MWRSRRGGYSPFRSSQHSLCLSIQFWAIKDTRKKQDSRTPLFVEYCYFAIKYSTKFYYMVENSIQFLIYTEIKAPNSSYAAIWIWNNINELFKAQIYNICYMQKSWSASSKYSHITAETESLGQQEDLLLTWGHPVGNTVSYKKTQSILTTTSFMKTWL